jgi:hypothetical protein
MYARRADDIPVVPLNNLARTHPIAGLGQLSGCFPVLRDAEQPDAGHAVIP